MKLNEPLCERAFGRTQGFHAKFTVGKYRTNRKGDTQIQISNSDFDQDFRSTSAWWRSSVSAGFLTEVFLTVIVKSKETKQINKKWRNIILYETLLRLPVGPHLQASCIVCLGPMHYSMIRTWWISSKTVRVFQQKNCFSSSKAFEQLAITKEHRYSLEELEPKKNRKLSFKKCLINIVYAFYTWTEANIVY